METELVKYEEKVINEKNYDIIEKYRGDELVESRREFYQVLVMNDDRKYRVSPQDFGKIEELLNDPKLKFIQIAGDLIAVHQITKVEKRSERTFGIG
jgi:hypothetical protein